MKKTIVALSVASLFSAGVAAETMSNKDKIIEAQINHLSKRAHDADIRMNNAEFHAKNVVKDFNDRATMAEQEFANVRKEGEEAMNVASSQINHLSKRVHDADIRMNNAEFHAKRTVEDIYSKGETAYNKLRAEGGREVAKVESAISGVDKGLRLDGQAAYNKLRAEGGREVAKVESAISGVDKGLRMDGQAAYNKLRAEGGREVAKVESAISGVDKGLRIDGQAAYNKLRAEGGREVAKLESVADGLNRKMDLMEKDGTKYVQEKADAAVAKSSAALRKDGEKALNVATSQINHLSKRAHDADIRMNNAEFHAKQAVESINTDVSYNRSQAELAHRRVSVLDENVQYNRSQADLAHRRVTAVEVNGEKAVNLAKDEFAKVRKEIAESRNNDTFDIKVDEEAERRATEAVNTMYKDGEQAIRDAGSKVYHDAEEFASQAEAHASQAVEAMDAKIAALQAQIDDLKQNGGGNGGPNTNDIDDTHLDIEDNKKKIDEIYAIGKDIEDYLDKHGDKAVTEAGRQIAAQNTAIEDNTKRIDGLEADMKNMGNRMLVLEDRMDGVVASSHAITNARPVLSQAGQYGVGVGMGAAGQKKAIAIGGAMQFTENWSGSMSVNYETKGKVSKDQFSAGVGAQYVF
ncbi:YadA-like family protein [Vibrio tubiashii]|uniref:YadA C-terminal domain-containing protein n=1 Tax=Vibrio tubiashii TaxID=29498 RepID=UPI001EFE7CC4|nr:YadA-like family protein [Vibrio tubiashii]MCG9579472.1 YadA-like family protein [Vibrio tubiashii]